MLDELVSKIKTKLASDNLFYFSLDPERALGLEQLLKENLTIVASQNSQYYDLFKQAQIKYLHINSENLQTLNSHQLIASKQFVDYFEANKTSTNYFQTFKISSAFAKNVQKLNGYLLNTDGQQNRLFENKISQYNMLVNTSVNLPKSLVIDLSNNDYQQLSEQLGARFVVQFNRSHTGQGTFFINNANEYQNLVALFPGRSVKVSEFISGEAYTVNACVTRQGTLIAGLSYQLTGISQLTMHQGGTVGNDWQQRIGFEDQTQQQIINLVTQIGDVMYKAGYLGLFGVDLIIKQGVPYFIEINARQAASVAMWSKIQLLENQVPLALFHLLEFMQIDYTIDINQYNFQNTSPLPYSQIFMRAKQNTLINKQISMGVYRLQSDNSAYDFVNDQSRANVIYLDEDQDKPLILQKSAYSIDQIPDQSMLILSPAQGVTIAQGAELARLQLKSSAFEKDGQIKPWILEIFKTLELYMS